MAEFKKQKKALQKFIKTFDEKIESISKAATFKLTPEAQRKINENFHDQFELLDQKLGTFVSAVEKKAHSIIDEINTKDRRIAMPRADFWLNRILNYILIGTLGRLLWIDIENGITTDALWNTFGWGIGVYIAVLLCYFIAQGLREK